ncbi:MAG TPA: hypothetical protein VMX55_00985 [candidate division Zixibacteria bacterium]|nr:hypothetical protein [candidate division Zixibacteria bacterium]
MFNEDIQRANQLRKEEKYSEAKVLYANLWIKLKDPNIGAGYLHCLRKLKEKQNVIKLAYELKDLNLNNDWVNIEILWALAIYELKNLENYNSALVLANYLLTLLNNNPNKIALEIIHETMVKLALKNEKWADEDFWLDKIGKNNLTESSIGKSDWTKRSLWYYRKISCLFELGRYDESISLLEEMENLSLSWNILKLFLRIKAKILLELEKKDEAIQIYDKLIMRNPDWWLLHEKAKIMIIVGNKEEALKEFYRAACAFRQLDKLVTLFDDIGSLCLELKLIDEAVAHFILEKFVRLENGWKIKNDLIGLINSLIVSFPQYQQIESVKDALQVCRNIWQKAGVLTSPSTTNQKRDRITKTNREIRKTLSGKVKLVPEANYFFINAINESIISFETIMIKELHNGDRVIFDAEPSFDKKKNKESWRAINVKKV